MLLQIRHGSKSNWLKPKYFDDVIISFYPRAYDADYDGDHSKTPWWSSFDLSLYKVYMVEKE